jgi:hypothetical protein
MRQLERLLETAAAAAAADELLFMLFSIAAVEEEVAAVFIATKLFLPNPNGLRPFKAHFLRRLVRTCCKAEITLQGRGHGHRSRSPKDESTAMTRSPTLHTVPQRMEYSPQWPSPRYSLLPNLAFAYPFGHGNVNSNRLSTTSCIYKTPYHSVRYVVVD